LKREWKERKSTKTATQPREFRDLNLIDESEEEWDYLGKEWLVKNLGAKVSDDLKKHKFITTIIKIIIVITQDIPQQKNGSDCGIFCLQFAEYLSRNQSFDFEQRHTAYFRKRMLYETLTKTLLIL
jgi:hypothetical protein